jgi:Predicted oxidoreductases (related to aryl-alcohol dehydrogenases)
VPGSPSVARSVVRRRASCWRWRTIAASISFDNAETYNNGVAEQLMGDVLADLRFARDSYCVSSKVFSARSSSRCRPSEACRAST